MIKLFEEYNQYYYTEKDMDEFYNLCNDKTLIFSNDEINYLREKVKGKFLLTRNYKTGKYTYISFIKDGDSDRIFIYKLPDEWYIAEPTVRFDDMEYKYYKCDQLEGLVKCLNEL